MIDLLDRHRAGNEAQAQQIGEGGAIGGEERRKLALLGQSYVIFGTHRLAVEREAKGIVAQRVLEIVGQARIRPMKAEADKLDAVAAAVVLNDAALENVNGGVARARLKYVVGLGRQSG